MTTTVTDDDGPRAHTGAPGWRSAFDHSPIGVAVLDPAGTVVFVNPPLVRLAGRDDLVGVAVDELAVADEPLTALPEWGRLVSGELAAYDAERRFRAVEGAEPLVRLSIAGIRDEDGAVHMLVLQAHDVTAAREAEIALAARAINDDLTGLPNRWLTREWLARALAEQPATQVGVLSIDVDRLAAVNESLGHGAGDRLIAEVARRLRAAADEDDLVGRFSGDGFLIVCEGVSDADLAVTGDAILRSMLEPVQLGHTRHGASVCVGAATGLPGETADDLVLHAEMALARARKSGGAAFAGYDPAHDLGGDVADLQLEWQMRESVGAGELRAYYQPIVSLPERQLTGYEALVRWVHAERGLLLPSSFLAVAETNGLIANIGAWMLQQSTADAAGRMGPEIIVSVNASPLQLARPGFVDAVAAELEVSGLAPQRLQLEITETALLQAGPSLLADVTALRELGVRIALDDFGTGYSSLSLLHDLPVSTVKIDRSFVAPILVDRRSRAMVRAVLGMCADLGVDTVAEGVEDDAQAAALVGMGCTRAQGFLFGRPAPLP
jgi:diguanylate cyclase (GGDEF)-like protein/PAS domain S-box-containing protein